MELMPVHYVGYGGLGKDIALHAPYYKIITVVENSITVNTML